MRTLDELIDDREPGIAVLRKWAAQPGANESVVLPPAQDLRDAALLRLQVTTRSLLGAIAYETGGVVIGARLRLLGSGAQRSIIRCNDGVGGLRPGAPDDFILVADDVLGGLFALNGGRFGSERLGEIFYLAADSATWSPLEIGHSDFVSWCLTGDLSALYGRLEDIEALGLRPAPEIERVYSFYPFLWSVEGREGRPDVRLIDADESVRFRLDMLGFATG